MNIRDGYELIDNKSKRYYNGSRWRSSDSGYFTIIGKVTDGKTSSIHFLCKFDDGAVIISDMTNIKKGNVRSPNKKTYSGVGFIGQGKYDIWDYDKGEITKEGTLWAGMIARCYSKGYEETPYKFTIVCDRWKCFQNFREDVEKLQNYELWKSGKGYEMDKDILCEKQGRFPKIYSPETCMFVTKHDNVSESTSRKNRYGSVWKYDKEEKITMEKLFKIATKNKYRFDYKGKITVEDLWELSVEELDGIYKRLKAQQRNNSEESLLQFASKEDKELQNKIDIIKTIVNDKLIAKEKAARAAEKKAQNQRILEIMADKQDAALKEKSIDELKAMLDTEELDDED